MCDRGVADTANVVEIEKNNICQFSVQRHTIFLGTNGIQPVPFLPSKHSNKLTWRHTTQNKQEGEHDRNDTTTAMLKLVLGVGAR